MAMSESKPKRTGKRIRIKTKTQQYIEQMDEKERQAYEIAKSHLQSSFDIRKSLGFQKWSKDN
jgi:hypothetical protein